MKFEIEIEPLPGSRPFNWRKLLVIIACATIVWGLLIIVYLGIVSVNREDPKPGYEPGLRGPDGPTGQRGAPGDPSGIVEGIIAGTYNGVVIIPLYSREQIRISGKNTRGVAFNWQSRKVYWIEYGVGIKMADLDGSSAELRVAPYRTGK